MTNLEVVYLFGENNTMKLPSKVYAVDRMTNTFLIVDGWGKFHWVPMDKCVERSAYEFEHGLLIEDDYDDNDGKVAECYRVDPKKVGYR